MPPEDDALRKLRAEFRARLPRRVEEVAAALDEARARPGDAEALTEARRLVHTLKGTASSYGFAEIGASLEAVEAALEALAGSSPHGANLKSKLRPRSSPSSNPSHPPDSHPRRAWEVIGGAMGRVRAALSFG
jgi:HPt (histidine-containing phosphotransfer) domain-containing protein